MSFITSLSLPGLAIFLGFSCALVWVLHTICYRSEQFRNRASLYHFYFVGGLILLVGVVFCSICIGRDWGSVLFQGTPARSLMIGEVYRVHAQGGDAYILSKDASKDLFFYRATRQKNAVSEGTTFVVDRTGMWRETTTKWSGIPGELGPSK